MPSLSKGLERALRRSLALAKERRHEYATLEHLLLALIGAPDVRAKLGSNPTDVAKLERLAELLTVFLDAKPPGLVVDDLSSVKPTAGCARVVQRAAKAAESTDQSEITSLDVLVQILTQKESQAALYMEEAGIDWAQARRHRG